MPIPYLKPIWTKKYNHISHALWSSKSAGRKWNRAMQQVRTAVARCNSFGIGSLKLERVLFLGLNNQRSTFNVQYSDFEDYPLADKVNSFFAPGKCFIRK